MEKIKVYGTRWCGDTIRALRILDERKIQYEWVDINQSKEGAALVIQTNHGFRSVPTIFFPDGTILVEPTNHQLNEKLDALLN